MGTDKTSDSGWLSYVGKGFKRCDVQSAAGPDVTILFFFWGGGGFLN